MQKPLKNFRTLDGCRRGSRIVVHWMSCIGDPKRSMTPLMYSRHDMLAELMYSVPWRWKCLASHTESVGLAPFGVALCSVVGPPRESSNPVASRFRNQRRDLSLRNSRGDWTAIELFVAGVRGWKPEMRRFILGLPDDK